MSTYSPSSLTLPALHRGIADAQRSIARIGRRLLAALLATALTAAALHATGGVPHRAVFWVLLLGTVLPCAAATAADLRQRAHLRTLVELVKERELGAGAN